ncbi:MAG: glycosyltransferase family 2 protein [Bacteroidales bacterium]|nr:glycosyltransferase family 2 protein [Bacteroidales bacterium]
MGKEVFISYIVPCYKIEDYLPRCLESLGRQTIDSGEEVEYILVNDGSPDNCLEILREFASKDPRAVVINQENQGVSAARNAGLKEARGKYVFFLDGDDALTDDASQILFNVSKGNDADIIITNAYGVDDGKWESKRKWNTCGPLASGLYDPITFAEEVNMLPISFKAFRCELLIQNEIVYDKRLRVGEVFAFFVHALVCSSKVVFSSERVLIYTRRAGSVMRTVNFERDSSIVLTMESIDNSVSEKMPQLCGLASYNRALFEIVNLFGLFHFVRITSYSKEIGRLLKVIYGNRVVRGLKKYFLFKRFGFNKETGLCLLLSVFPMPFVYNVMRMIWKMKVNRLCAR